MNESLRTNDFFRGGILVIKQSLVVNNLERSVDVETMWLTALLSARQFSMWSLNIYICIKLQKLGQMVSSSHSNVTICFWLFIFGTRTPGCQHKITNPHLRLKMMLPASTW